MEIDKISSYADYRAFKSDFDTMKDVLLKTNEIKKETFREYKKYNDKAKIEHNKYLELMNKENELRIKLMGFR